jgi:hypothetical protein
MAFMSGQTRNFLAGDIGVSELFQIIQNCINSKADCRRQPWVNPGVAALLSSKRRIWGDAYSGRAKRAPGMQSAMDRLQLKQPVGKAGCPAATGRKAQKPPHFQRLAELALLEAPRAAAIQSSRGPKIG